MMKVVLFPVKLTAKLALYALSLVFMLAALVMGVISALSGKPYTVIRVPAALGATLGVISGVFDLTCIIMSYGMCLGVILIPVFFALIMNGFIKITGCIRDLADSIYLF